MLIVGVITTITKIANGAFTYLLASISLSMIAILLPMIFHWTRNQIIESVDIVKTFTDLPQDEITQITHNFAHVVISGDWKKWGYGIIVLVAGTITQISLTNPYHTFSIRLTSFIGSSVLLFFCGTAVYSVVISILTAFKMEKLPVQLPIYQDQNTGITAVNPIIFRFSLIMLALYALLFMGIYYGPYSFGMILLIWLTAIGIIIAITPPIGLWGFHTAMSKAKKDILLELSPHIEKAIIGSVNQPTQENLDHVHSLYALKKELEQLPEWPIDFKTIFTLFTTIMLPILAFALDILFK